MKAFPIAVVPDLSALVGPGTQPDDGTLDYISMPQGMHTYAAPILPEPEQLVALAGAHGVLRAVLAALDQACAGVQPAAIDVSGLDPANLALVNQVLGEGEVGARIDGARPARIQESVFAGVWRVVVATDDGLRSDHIEIGAAPALLRDAAAIGAPDTGVAGDVVLPDGVMNAPSILAEIDDRLAHYTPGAASHGINLTLLPLSERDVEYLDQRLGAGSVLILSRGYGNCRISATATAHCWRVVYFNSQDAVILDTIEVGGLPDVACAAPEDLEDSRERLGEVLQWVEGA